MRFLLFHAFCFTKFLCFFFISLSQEDLFIYKHKCNLFNKIEVPYNLLFIEFLTVQFFSQPLKYIGLFTLRIKFLGRNIESSNGDPFER